MDISHNGKTTKVAEKDQKAIVGELARKRFDAKNFTLLKKDKTTDQDYKLEIKRDEIAIFRTVTVGFDIGFAGEKDEPVIIYVRDKNTIIIYGNIYKTRPGCEINMDIFRSAAGE